MNLISNFALENTNLSGSYVLFYMNETEVSDYITLQRLLFLRPIHIINIVHDEREKFVLFVILVLQNQIVKIEKHQVVDCCF